MRDKLLLMSAGFECFISSSMSHMLFQAEGGSAVSEEDHGGEEGGNEEDQSE